MEDIEELEMFKRMESICKFCKHIEVDTNINRFYCNKFDMVVTGVVMTCPEFNPTKT